MGNYLSCSLYSPLSVINSSTKVILPSGEIRNLSGISATAAELMLEHPGYFLVHSSSIIVNRRLFALAADEELEIGVVYVMFPMDRVGSSASTADIARLVLSARKNSALDRAELAVENPMKLETMNEFRFRRSSCRSRKQVLETITEEIVF